MKESWKWRSGCDAERVAMRRVCIRGGKSPRSFCDEEGETAERDGDVMMPAFGSSGLSSYVHHAIAGGASAEDVAELRELIEADDDALDALYAPEPITLADHDPHEAMYEAMSTLTRRRPSNDEVSSALESWAFGSQQGVQEHAWEPPVRLGVCAWLARVALEPKDNSACLIAHSV
jgi:hypothetical protein